MTLRSYFRMLLATMTLMFVVTGCKDTDKEDDNGPEATYTFQVATSNVTVNSVAVTVTPSDAQATYYTAVVKKADYDAFKSDDAFLQENIAQLKAEAQKQSISFKEYLASVVSKGSSPETISGLTPETAYYAYVFGITLDGKTTSTLTKAAFTTAQGEKPVETVTFPKAGGYFYGNIFSESVDSYSFWMSESGVSEELFVFNGQGTYIVFALNVTKTGNPLLRAGTFPIYSGTGSEENTFEPGVGGGDTFTGSAIAKINADGSKDYIFIDGGTLKVEGSGNSYVVTVEVTGGGKTYKFEYRGAVSIYDTTNPGGGGPVLDITLTPGLKGADTDTKMSVDMKNTGTTVVSGKYLMDFTSVFEEALAEGVTDADLLATYGQAFDAETIDAINSAEGTAAMDWYFDNLPPNTSYTFVANVVDDAGKSALKNVAKSTTAAPVGEGPALSVSIVAGYQGANTQTMVTAVFKVTGTPQAVSGKYLVVETATLQATLDKGATLDQIMDYEGNAEAFTADELVELNSDGKGWYWENKTPGTSYTAVAKVKDASGKSTLKSAKVSTDQAGEATDAYKAWLGTWTVTSASSETEKKPVTFDVIIGQKTTNATYSLQGWSVTGWRDDVQAVVPIVFESAKGRFGVNNDTKLGDLDDGELMFMTRYYDATDKAYYIVSGGITGLIGTMGADKQSATVNGGTFTFKDDPTEYTVSAMEYYNLKTADGKYWGWKPTEGFTDTPVGPYTMVKKSASTASKSSVGTRSKTLANMSRIMGASEVVKMGRGVLSNSGTAVIDNSAMASKHSAIVKATPARSREMTPIFPIEHKTVNVFKK